MRKHRVCQTFKICCTTCSEIGRRLACVARPCQQALTCVTLIKEAMDVSPEDLSVLTECTIGSVLQYRCWPFESGTASHTGMDFITADPGVVPG